MKKQKLTAVSLKLKKVNIANLFVTGGANVAETIETYCCSRPPVCQHTVTTRPDSLADA